MPYLNVDDNFAEHPKVEPLSDAAFRLHVAAMCYAAKHLTDGVVSAKKARRMTDTYKPSVLAELLDAGLWVPHPDGYEIHDYLQWNKSREWWTHKRETDAKRVASWRANKARNTDPNDGSAP